MSGLPGTPWPAPVAAPARAVREGLAADLARARARPAPATRALGPRHAADPLDAVATQRRSDFSAALARQAPSKNLAEDARAAAEEFLAVALVQPILASLRSSDRTPAPFAPGPAEKSFRAFADSHVARQVVRSGNFGLTDRLARDLLSRSQPSAPVAAGPAAGAPRTQSRP